MPIGVFFAGSCGHTYGHNAIMQMLKPGYPTSYGTDGTEKTWYQALDDPGFNQMKHLKNLMLTMPYFERVPDQSIIVGRNGERYNRLLATRGKDYLMVYNYNCVPMKIDLGKVSGDRKNVWWMDAATGCLDYIGEFDSRIVTFAPQKGSTRCERRRAHSHRQQQALSCQGPETDCRPEPERQIERPERVGGLEVNFLTSELNSSFFIFFNLLSFPFSQK